MRNTFGFRPHGEARISGADRIVTVHSTGPWNAEHVRLGHEWICGEGAKFEHKPWVILGFIHGEGLHTPESYEAQRRYIMAQREIGRCATALIFDDTPLKSFLQDMFKRMYVGTGEQVAFFDSESEARTWLAERLAEADQASRP